MKTQNFHWNVTGNLFWGLHNLFEEQYQDLATAVDDVAERIRTLGLSVPGSFYEILRLKSLPEANENLSTPAMIQQLINDHTVIARNAYSILKQAETAGDMGTTELLSQRIATHEKMAWMLQSLDS